MRIVTELLQLGKFASPSSFDMGLVSVFVAHGYSTLRAGLRGRGASYCALSLVTSARYLSAGRGGQSALPRGSIPLTAIPRCARACAGAALGAGGRSALPRFARLPVHDGEGVAEERSDD